MFESKDQPLATIPVFYRRMAWHLMVVTMLLAACLTIGILGYHFIAHISWIDSIHNASMILSGMGPVVTIENISGKLFSSFYALFSGIAFITNIGILLTPLAHRLYHRLHIDDDE